MKTIQDFYDKYGTGKNYEDLFAMMCRAKNEQYDFLTEECLYTKPYWA